MKPLPLTLSALLLSLLPVLPAQEKVHELMTIDGAGSGIGRSSDSVANMGDLDGDGIDDLAIGSGNSPSNPITDGEVIVYSVGKRQVLTRILGKNKYGRFGFRVENLGDVDKDGVADIGIGSPTAPRIGTRNGPGMVFVYSGKTWKLLYSVTSASRTSRPEFGSAITALGDVDKDGYDDFAVGANGASPSGLVFVYSGRNGALRYYLNPATRINSFGKALVGISDIDGDKIRDLAVLGISIKVSNVWRLAPISLYSGKTGLLIRRIVPAAGTADGVSDVLRSSPDIDGDKKPELYIGRPRTTRSGLYHGAVQVYSSGTGKLLTTIQSKTGNRRESFALDFDVLPDMDQDGSPEVIVSDYDYLSGMASRGAVHLFSAKTGKLIETITTPAQKRAQFYNSRYVGYLGDLNRDGNPEFYSQGIFSYPTRDVLQILSAKPLDLTGEENSLSIYKGGKTVLSIHAGLKHAKDLALMIGSASGSYPGIKMGKDTLHLNADAYFSFTLAAPHAVIFNNLSLLDTKGEGKMGFTLPTGLPTSLAGTKLHHSCLFIGKGKLGFANTSVPLLITLF